VNFAQMTPERGIAATAELSLGENMSTDSRSLPLPWKARWGARIRNAVPGMKYAALVTLGLMLGWDMQSFIENVAKFGWVIALKEAGSFMLVMAIHQLPPVPAAAIAVELAPRSGARRYLWLTGVGVAIWAYCTTFWFFLGELEAMNIRYGFMVALIVAACAYRSSARTASSEFVHKQIESTALDADVKRARLQLLRAQIEPHFLFNTLATVRALARVDRRAAVEMVDNLMRYLSEALPKLRHEESSLADELQLVDAYLRIHQIRMGTRLSYELLVPPQLGADRIPTMMLLTLVENAVKHGINPTVAGGTIRITASHEESQLVLKVADSGGGMAATEGHGMGLANIRRRLTMLYGDSAVLSLARAATRGVVATVSIPLPRAT
jgi:signal transduction histidine kinase